MAFFPFSPSPSPYVSPLTLTPSFPCFTPFLITVNLIILTSILSNLLQKVWEEAEIMAQSFREKFATQIEEMNAELAVQEYRLSDVDEDEVEEEIPIANSDWFRPSEFNLEEELSSQSD